MDTSWTNWHFWCSFFSFAGSRIRAIVALTPFDEFHRHSAAIIQTAVFGRDAAGKLLPRLKFDVNNLVSTGQP